MMQVIGKEKTFAVDSVELVKRIANYFVMEISSEANNICTENGKKKMTPEHLFGALKVKKKSKSREGSNLFKQKKKLNAMEAELRQEHEDYVKSGVKAKINK
jgi:Histone-like transcription factor (CBF/NF-Y) and archaeal histone